MNPKRKKLFIGLIALLVLVVLTVLGFLIYNYFFSGNGEEIDNTEEQGIEDVIVDEEEEEEEDIEEEVLSLYQGEYINARLPEDWRIIEYTDGDGTESLPDYTEYTGLTAIDIINPENKQVFSIQAVSGIGFTECFDYPIFPDNNPEYMQEQKEMNEEMGEELTTIDYTNTPYSEFLFLNTRFRRVGRKYFYDTKTDSNNFEPPCVEGILNIEGLNFKDSENYRYEAYFYGPTEEAMDNDLLVIDQILSTITLVN